MNIKGIIAIYKYEMSRAIRTFGQSIASPVLSTALYFIVFGSAIGSRIGDIDGVSYSSFIVPGLIMLTVLTQSLSNASFGIFFPKFSGTIYEVLSAPISPFEITTGYVTAAATKSVIVGTIILITSTFFVDLNIKYPFEMFCLLILISLTFSLFGFIIGIWANDFQRIQLIPSFVITPLTFLGGSFYSINMLSPTLQSISKANPMLYVVNTFREGMLGVSDVSVAFSLGMICVFICILTISCLYLLNKGTGIRE